MATRKRRSAQEQVDDLEQVLVDAWHEAQNADGSRGGMQEALDNIQGLIEAEIPDVEDREVSDPEDQDTDEEND